MNIAAIVAAIIALLGGVAIGTSINTNESENFEYKQRGQANHETPLASDFVSMHPVISELPVEELSQAEIDGLLLMREEEKLARDVYQTLYDNWGLNIFANIAQSEQTHTQAVRELLEKYELTDPVTDDSIGVFVNQDLQTLYNELTERGAQSEVEALKVGAYIEDLDIKDLQELIAETDNQDITEVYQNLVRGSRNHMRAFTRQLEMRGESYAPSFISAEEYSSIVESEQERGGHSEGKNGQGGRGWGNR
jgi:hypothetical protein